MYELMDILNILSLIKRFLCTCLLAHAGKLIAARIDPVAAARGAIAQALTDDVAYVGGR